MEQYRKGRRHRKQIYKSLTELRNSDIMNVFPAYFYFCQIKERPLTDIDKPLFDDTDIIIIVFTQQELCVL